MARDLTTGNTTEPVPYKENPDYKEGDGSPKFLPDEPYIGLSGVSDDEKPQTVQTGYVRGGTTNPPKGSDGKVERVAFTSNTEDFVHGGKAPSTGPDKDGRTKVNPDLDRTDAKAPKK